MFCTPNFSLELISFPNYLVIANTCLKNIICWNKLQGCGIQCHIAEVHKDEREACSSTFWQVFKLFLAWITLWNKGTLQFFFFVKVFLENSLYKYYLRTHGRWCLSRISNIVVTGIFYIYLFYLFLLFCTELERYLRACFRYRHVRLVFKIFTPVIFTKSVSCRRP